jgi:hypothetical protein
VQECRALPPQDQHRADNSSLHQCQDVFTPLSLHEPHQQIFSALKQKNSAQQKMRAEP